MVKKVGIIDVKVRMTRDLHRRLVRDAERDGLTLNSEILRRIEQGFDAAALYQDTHAMLKKLQTSMTPTDEERQMLKLAEMLEATAEKMLKELREKKS
jgi:hypothetical protein